MSSTVGPVEQLKPESQCSKITLRVKPVNPDDEVSPIMLFYLNLLDHCLKLVSLNSLFVAFSDQLSFVLRVIQPTV